MAQRKPKLVVLKHRDVLSWTWPLFVWRTCDACGKDFRREAGWKRDDIARQFTFYGGGFGSIHRHYDYVCGHCAPTRDAAIAHFGLPLTGTR